MINKLWTIGEYALFPKSFNPVPGSFFHCLHFIVHTNVMKFENFNSNEKRLIHVARRRERLIRHEGGPPTLEHQF